MFEALSRGLAALKLHKKSIILPYLANLLVGLTLAVPFAFQFEAMLDESAYEGHMLGGLDFVWMEWFRDHDGGLGSTFGPTLLGIAPFLHHLELILTGELHRLPVLILTVGALYLVLQSFMTAAILGSLANDPGGTTVREFFRNGSEFFGRVLRVRLLSLSLLGVGIWLIGLPLGERAVNLALTAPTDRRAFLIALGFQGAVLAVILSLKLISDMRRSRLRIRTGVRSFWVTSQLSASVSPTSCLPPDSICPWSWLAFSGLCCTWVWTR